MNKTNRQTTVQQTTVRQTLVIAALLSVVALNGTGCVAIAGAAAGVGGYKLYEHDKKITALEKASWQSERDTDELKGRVQVVEERTGELQRSVERHERALDSLGPVAGWMSKFSRKEGE